MSSVLGGEHSYEEAPRNHRLLPDVKEGSMLIMAVGNSRFAGGGYEVAPQATGSLGARRFAEADLLGRDDTTIAKAMARLVVDELDGTLPA